MTMFKRIALSAVLALGALDVNAQDFDKALAAAQAGNFETALKEWLPLAKQGNASAQYNLGIIYNKGEGVPQDSAEAVKWYRLAADQGYASAQYCPSSNDLEHPR